MDYVCHNYSKVPCKWVWFIHSAFWMEVLDIVKPHHLVMITSWKYILVIYGKCYVVVGEILDKQNLWNYSVSFFTFSFFYLNLFPPHHKNFGPQPQPSPLFSIPMTMFKKLHTFSFPYFLIILKTYVHTP